MNSIQTLPTHSLSDQNARQWYAELSLELEKRGAKTLLVGNRHQGPLRVERPFYPEPGGGCHIYLLHPPGGLVLGDLLQIKISAKADANAQI